MKEHKLISFYLHRNYQINIPEKFKLYVEFIYRTGIPDMLFLNLSHFCFVSCIQTPLKMNRQSTKSKHGMPLLQGELYINIYEAKDLPDMEGNLIDLVYTLGQKLTFYPKINILKISIFTKVTLFIDQIETSFWTKKVI